MSIKIFFGSTLLIMSVSANATLLSTTGNGILSGAAPADLSEGASESSMIQGFDEKQGVVINSAIGVDYDVSSSGIMGLTGFNNNVGGGGGTGTLGAGTYNSHLIHFDPLGQFSGAMDSGSATFTFDGLIVALIMSIDNLMATDSQFNMTTTDWNSGDNVNGRRSEATDTFSFVGNTLTIGSLRTNQRNVDHIRVLTKVPEPGTIALFGLGLAGLGFGRRRKT